MMYRVKQKKKIEISNNLIYNLMKEEEKKK